MSYDVFIHFPLADPLNSPISDDEGENEATEVNENQPAENEEDQPKDQTMHTAADWTVFGPVATVVLSSSDKGANAQYQLTAQAKSLGWSYHEPSHTLVPPTCEVKHSKSS